MSKEGALRARVFAEMVFEKLTEQKMFLGYQLLLDMLLISSGQKVEEVNTNITNEQGKRVAYIAFLGIHNLTGVWGPTAARLIVSNPSDIRLLFTERLSEKTNATCCDYARAFGLELLDGVKLYNVGFERLKLAIKDTSKVVILDYSVVQDILHKYGTPSLDLRLGNWRIREIPREGTVFAKAELVAEMWINELRMLSID